MIGKTVSHYEILERLGAGGMGVVYKARDLLLDRHVVLKFLSVHLDREVAARERFLREARAASALDHPNLCTVHEIGEAEDGSLFICMAYYEGESLRDRLRRGPVPMKEALELVVQVCRGLARAHEAGIVHRDLKPANIMLTRRGEAKIVDFGLAVLAGEASLTRSGTTVGTVAYMSPEQARGESVDQRTDLWSLGVVLYEMITGSYPFPGELETAVRLAILAEEPKPPSSLSPRIPEWLDSVVMRLLAKRKDDRFDSAEEVIQALRREETQPPSTASLMRTETMLTPAARRRERRWSGRQVAIGAAAVVGLVLLGVLAVRWIPIRGAPRLDRVAVLPFDDFTGRSPVTSLGEAIGADLITRLGEVPGLEVVGRTEAWRQLAGGAESARELGKALGVGAVVEGQVQRQGDGMAVSAHLVDARNGRVLWTETVRGRRDDLSPLQERLGGRLAKLLEITLAESERRRIARDPTRAFQAYGHYLRAWELLDDISDTEDAAPAAEMFRQALRLEPTFALAHAGLSDALWQMGERGGDARLLRQAETEAKTALGLVPDLPEGLVALARVQRSTGRVGDSIGELEKLLERHPDPEAAYRALAAGYERAGDLDEAERLYRAATTVGEGDWRAWNNLGAFYWKVGHYAEAGRAFIRAAEIAPPEITKPRDNLATLEFSQGHFDEAIAAYEAIGPIDDAVLASNAGTAYYFSSAPDKWEKAEHYYRLAVRLDPRNDEIRRNLADLCATLGQKDEAEEHYRAALSIVGDRLESDPDSPDLKLRKAFYGAKVGACEDATSEAASLEDGLPETAENEHRLASVFALCGVRDEALAALRSAVALGYSPDLLRREDEFESLRGDPEFERVLQPVPGGLS